MEICSITSTTGNVLLWSLIRSESVTYLFKYNSVGVSSNDSSLVVFSGRPCPSVAGFLRAATQTLAERSPRTSWYLSPGHTGSPNPDNEKNSTDAEAKRLLLLWRQPSRFAGRRKKRKQKLVNHQHPECEVMLCLRYSYSTTLLTRTHAFKNILTYKRMPWHCEVCFALPTLHGWGGWGGAAAYHFT